VQPEIRPVYEETNTVLFPQGVKFVTGKVGYCPLHGINFNAILSI